MAEADSDPSLRRHRECYRNQILYLLENHKELDLTTLIGCQDESLKEYYITIKKLEKSGYLQTDLTNGSIKITPEGSKQIPEQAKKQVDAPFNLSCKWCEGRGIIKDPKTKDNVLNFLQDILQNRPKADEEFDQWYMDPIHAAYRTSFIYERGDLFNKSMLFIGDDDLVSVASAVTKLPNRVVLLDIDQRLIDFANEIAKKYDLPLEAHRFDIRFPLPKDFIGQFDVFGSDPIETVEGMELFFSRGFSALKGIGSSAYFGLTTLEASKKKWFEIQKILLDMNMSITDIRRNFTEYPDPGWEEKLTIWKSFGTKPTGSAWYKSAFYRVEAIGKIEPRITGEHGLTDDIYHDPETWATTEFKYEVEI